MMRPQKLANISPWLLAAACGLLTVIIGVFALSNYARERQLMEESLIRQGLTIARFISSSSRAYLRGTPRTMEPRLGKWEMYVQLAIDNSSSQPGLVRVALVNEEGKILASSSVENVGEQVEEDTMQFVRRLLDDAKGEEFYTFREIEGGPGEAFQFALPYHPLGGRERMAMPWGRGGRFQRHRLGPEDRFSGGGDAHDSLLSQILHNRFFLIIELDQSEFSESVKRQLFQIATLSLVLLLVGTGGWLSLLTLQGFRGSQRRLSRIRQFTDILIASLPVGLIATDAEGKIRICNATAEEMLDILSAKILGKSPDDALPLELAGEIQKKLSYNGGSQQKEAALRMADGTEKSLLLTAVPVVDDDGNYAGSTLLFQDLSQMKKLQNEVRRNERLAALGKMAAGIAHELRNPLSSVKGLALLLKAKVKNDQKGVETADVLVQEVERLNRSIGELLDYARPHTLNREPVEMVQLLDKAVALLEADVHTGSITVSKKYENGSLVYGDRDKLTQLFLNLLLNAIQAMPAGGSLGIRLFEQEKRVICSIEDNGCGVDSYTAQRVFDPYFTTKSSGTGLGLAMSAKIVEEHGGTIELSSVAGAGTTVVVSLPVYSGGS